MGTGDDHPVGRQGIDAIGMHIFVGDDVVANGEMMEKGIEVGIRSKVPPVRSGPQLQHRAPPRTVHHPATIGVFFVVGAADFGVMSQVFVFPPQAAAGGYKVGAFKKHAMVGIGHIGARRHE